MDQTDSQATATPTREPLPASIEDMDEIIAKEGQAFLDAGKGLDPIIEEQVSCNAYE